MRRIEARKNGQLAIGLVHFSLTFSVLENW